MSKVKAAELALKQAKDNLTEAQGVMHSAELAVKSAGQAVAEAVQCLTAAQTEADASLPQCTIVTRARYSGKEVSRLNAVILRKTPAGQLVLRYVGDANAKPIRFKPANWAIGGFVPVERSEYQSGSIHLENVPKEFA